MFSYEAAEDGPNCDWWVYEDKQIPQTRLSAAAGFDRDEDHWPRRWAEAYVDFAAGEKRSWLLSQWGQGPGENPGITLAITGPWHDPVI